MDSTSSFHPLIRDVHRVSYGFRDTTASISEDDIFYLGEENGGLLDVDVSQPKLVEIIDDKNIDLVAYDEYHICTITLPTQGMPNRIHNTLTKDKFYWMG